VIEQCIRSIEDAEAAILRARDATDGVSFKRAYREGLAELRTAEQRLYGGALREVRAGKDQAKIRAFEAWWKSRHPAKPKDPLLRGRRMRGTTRSTSARTPSPRPLGAHPEELANFLDQP
jgi:hypothetical protein